MAEDGYDANNPAHLLAASLEWLASGEREVPPVLAGLPDEDRAALLGEAHRFGQALSDRLSELGLDGHGDPR